MSRATRANQKLPRPPTGNERPLYLPVGQAQYDMVLASYGRAVDRLRAMMAGHHRRPAMKAAISWALQFVLRDIDVDALVFFVPERVPITELAIPPAIACGVVGFVMATASVRALTPPVVVGLPAGALGEVEGYAAWSYGAKRIWIVPDENGLRLSVRSHPAPPESPTVDPVPDEGPLGLPALSIPDPKYIYRDFDPPRACPHCGVVSSRYRALSRGFVCLACACSTEFGG